MSSQPSRSTVIPVGGWTVRLNRHPDLVSNRIERSVFSTILIYGISWVAKAAPESSHKIHELALAQIDKGFERGGQFGMLKRL